MSADTPPAVAKWLSEQHQRIEDYEKLKEAHARQGAELELARQRALDYERQNQLLLVKLERLIRIDEALRTRLAGVSESVRAALEESRRSAAQLDALPSIAPQELDALDEGIRHIAQKFAPTRDVQ